MLSCCPLLLVLGVCGFPWGRFLVRFGMGAVILTWMGLLWLLGGVHLVTGLAACPWVLGVLHLQAGVLVDVSLRLWVGASWRRGPLVHWWNLQLVGRLLPSFAGRLCS